MKTKLPILILFVNCLMVLSCQKHEFDLRNPDVDKFVSLLKSGSYLDEAGYELPDFSVGHIGRLLYHSTDTTMINMFPTNPLSSKYTEPKILAECLLWTVDGIRLGNKYPSLEPCLVDTPAYSELTGYPRLSGMELLDLTEIYLEWYQEFQRNPTETIKTKNLLENTTYKWN